MLRELENAIKLPVFCIVVTWVVASYTLVVIFPDFGVVCCLYVQGKVLLHRR